jgi:hypothetical protein
MFEFYLKIYKVTDEIKTEQIKNFIKFLHIRLRILVFCCMQCNILFNLMQSFLFLQIFYVLFLILFSVATLYPNCGMIYLDLAVFGWVLMIWLEVVRSTFSKWKVCIETWFFKAYKYSILIKTDLEIKVFSF